MYAMTLYIIQENIMCLEPPVPADPIFWSTGGPRWGWGGGHTDIVTYRLNRSSEHLEHWPWMDVCRFRFYLASSDRSKKLQMKYNFRQHET